MRKHSFRLVAPAVCAATLLWFAVASLGSPPGTNLIDHGSFDQGTAGWAMSSRGRPDSIAFPSDGTNTWALLRGPSASIAQRILLHPNWLSLRVSARMRATDVAVGKESWQDARLAMDFKDAAGKHLSPWPNVFHATGSTEWVSHRRVYKVPPGAATLDINPAIFGPSGTVEFDDISVAVARIKGMPLADAPLPVGAPDTEDLSRAWSRSSATRAELCLNGLWRFLPVDADAAAPPAHNNGWGWLKVPGVWPTSDASAQIAFLPEDSDPEPSRDLARACYRRQIVVPPDWSGRRILLDFRMVQTHARIWIDGKPSGEIFFPGGRVDVTAAVQPGKKHDLALLVTAIPLDAESNVFMAPERIITSKAVVKLKGLTGDVMLVSEPPADAIDDVQIRTSVRGGKITIDTGLANPRAGQRVLTAEILEGGKITKTFQSEPFDATALKEGRLAFSAPWTDAKLWDTDSPANLYEAVVTLADERGHVLDRSLPVRFGFREFTIDGRDFVLNGRRIHLRALHSSNINGAADIASIEGCRNTCRRLASHGFNFLITANYNFGPGEVSYMDALFDACDESGILAAFSLPHAKDFSWKLDTPEQSARYRALCEWLIRRAQNHPSIILYSMNHNATGYYGDQNPVRMDGVYEPHFPPRPTPDPKAPPRPDSRTRNRAQAQLAADIARSLDPTRPVYHHQSGNLGDLYTVNIYLNWAPLQERSDWLEHWSAHGKKPLFFVEWGLPHISSWSSFRGPAFIWRNPALQQIWDSEFAVTYKGEGAYQMTEAKVSSMKWEEELWAKGEPFFWSNLIRHLRSQDENYTEIQALFAADNWRSHRTWGISAMLPWDQENLWRKTESFPSRSVPAPERWQNLQSPGIVPDQLTPPSQYIYCRQDDAMRPSVLGDTFIRWNMPLCGFVAGSVDRFTEKSHVFHPGDTIAKQLVILNDTRHPISCNYSWSVPSLNFKGNGKNDVPPGQAALLPIEMTLPETAPSATAALEAVFDFGAGGIQRDATPIHILAKPPEVALRSRVGLWDPKDLTAPALRRLGVKFTQCQPPSEISAVDLLVIGRQALTVDGPGPELSRVADGLRVLLFEQDADVLERRFGFRINIHGLRQTFPRAATHPVLAGLGAEHLRDWRGAATLVPPHLDITGVETADPKWRWCGFENTRVWRCGNNGSVATVLIEKPERGDWLPIVDGGFDLQYAPLLECTHGKGHIVFCQLDVTGRTADEPAALTICVNLLRHLDAARPTSARPVMYSGNADGLDLLKRLGHEPGPYEATSAAAALVVLGPGHQAQHLDAAVAAGARVFCLGLSSADLDRAFTQKIETKEGPAISQPLNHAGPATEGIGTADLHWRTAPSIAALPTHTPSGPALAVLPRGKGQIVLCQAAPWMFDYEKKPYLRTTYRRNVFLVSRLLANLGARAHCPIIDRFARPPKTPEPWLDALYLQNPIADDDPYRYYRW